MESEGKEASEESVNDAVNLETFAGSPHRDVEHDALERQEDSRLVKGRSNERDHPVRKRGRGRGGVRGRGRKGEGEVERKKKRKRKRKRKREGPCQPDLLAGTRSDKDAPVNALARRPAEPEERHGDEHGGVEGDLEPDLGRQVRVAGHARHNHQLQVG